MLMAQTRPFLWGCSAPGPESLAWVTWVTQALPPTEPGSTALSQDHGRDVTWPSGPSLIDDKSSLAIQLPPVSQ